MRRLFILRKDLHMSFGKAVAMACHCAESYWTMNLQEKSRNYYEDHSECKCEMIVSGKIMDEYIKGSFVKTICQARNKNHLLKAKIIARELGLIEGTDFGEINDNCLTELTPENEDGTTLVGIWFKPLEDDIAHKISKKYHLYT